MSNEQSMAGLGAQSINGTGRIFSQADPESELDFTIVPSSVNLLWTERFWHLLSTVDSTVWRVFASGVTSFSIMSSALFRKQYGKHDFHNAADDDGPAIGPLIPSWCWFCHLIYSIHRAACHFSFFKYSKGLKRFLFEPDLVQAVPESALQVTLSLSHINGQCQN